MKSILIKEINHKYVSIMKNLYEHSIDPKTGKKKTNFTINFGKKKFINRYHKSSQLFKNNYSEIYIIEKVKTREKFICKIIPSETLRKQEFIIPNNIDSPRIIKIREIVQAFIEGQDKTFMIMDYHPEVIDVFDYVVGRDLKTEQQVKPLFREMCLAIKDCHEAGCCHGDIKMENFIILNTEENKYDIKLIDFGFAFYDGPDDSRFFGGTRKYVAPEVFRSRQGSRASDIWSIGAVIFYTLTSRNYLPGMPLSNNRFSQELVALLENCLVIDPSRRFDINNVLESEWFSCD